MQDIDNQQATATYLGVSTRTLEDWRYRRVGPPYAKVGRAVRYRREAVDAWAKAQTVWGW